MLAVNEARVDHEAGADSDSEGASEGECDANALPLEEVEAEGEREPLGDGNDDELRDSRIEGVGAKDVPTAELLMRGLPDSDGDPLEDAERPGDADGDCAADVALGDIEADGDGVID